MSKVLEKNGKQFVMYRPKDSLDVGFRVPGMQLRWVADRQTEDRFGRPWKTLRESDLPKELADELKRRGLFSKGDTIRKAELVLAFASEEETVQLRKELDAINADKMSRIVKQSPAKGVRVDEHQTQMSQLSSDNYK